MVGDEDDRSPQALRNATAGRSCDGCGRPFVPKRTMQRHCRPACRVRALRQRRADAIERDHTMTDAHHAHVDRVLDQFGAELRAKYQRGQAEHGGRLWERAGLLDAAIEEATDLVVYLFTLREQQRASELKPVSGT